MKLLISLISGLAIVGLMGCGSGSVGGGSTAFSNVNTGANNSNNNNGNNNNPQAGSGSTFVFRFAATGNASIVDLMSVGTLTPIFTTITGARANPATLQANFLQIYNPALGTNPPAPQSKSLVLILSKPTGIVSGDVFTFSTPATLIGAFADYSEDYSGPVRNWSSTGGTITVNSLVTGTANLTVSNLILTPTTVNNNTAVGTVTVNGSASLAY